MEVVRENAVEEVNGQPSRSSRSLLISVFVVIIIVVATFAAVSGANQAEDESDTPAGQTTGTLTSTPVTTTQTETGDVSETGLYMDGTYTAIGSYNSPAGVEQIEVTLTLVSGEIVDSAVVSLGKHNTSKRMQELFIENYEGFVEGMSIDEVELDTIGGSSLTPRGFEEALEAIKNEARA